MVWFVETTCLYSWNCLLDSPKPQSIDCFIYTFSTFFPLTFMVLSHVSSMLNLEFNYHIRKFYLQA